jgi:hypothetical protein
MRLMSLATSGRACLHCIVLTHSRVGLGNTTTDTTEHARGSLREAERAGSVLLNLTRGENEDGTLGGRFDPSL